MHHHLLPALLAVCGYVTFHFDNTSQMSAATLTTTVAEENTVPCNFEYNPGQNAVWTDDVCKKAATSCEALPCKEVTIPIITTDFPYINLNKKVCIPQGICTGKTRTECPGESSARAGGGSGSVSDGATFNCDQSYEYGCHVVMQKLRFTFLGREYQTLIKFPVCVLDGMDPTAGSGEFCGEYGIVAACGNTIPRPSDDPPIIP